MKRGKFIVLEGLDACGKSTICKNLAKNLNLVKMNALPNEIKPWLARIGDTKLAEATFSYFTLCNFFKSQEIEELLAKGKNVLLDRYFYTTYVYHSEIIEKDFPLSIKKAYKQLLQPDLIIFLDVPQEIRKERILKRNEILQWYGDAVSLKTDLTEKYFKLFDTYDANVLKVDNHKNTIEQTLSIITPIINKL